MSGMLVAPLERELAPSTAELHAVLSRALGQRGSRAHIVEIERARYAYGSSWRLEEITVRLSDESQVALVFKDLVREADGSGARRVKPDFVTNPIRESWVYQNLLMDASAGPPKLWASVNDVGASRHWLFIERVNGVPLAQIGDRDAWCAAAEWLGRFHATAPVGRAVHGPLLRHDHEYHRRWFRRALSGAEEDARSSNMAREKLARLRVLASAHERAMQIALAARPSLIHGEFYPSNVLIEQTGAGFAVHTVDWEMAALGPPLLDVAALVTGRWSTSDRIAMTSAYREGRLSAGVRSPLLAEFLRSVTAYRLLLAVQWLGWAADWTAPVDHRNDWLEEAELCATELRG